MVETSLRKSHIAWDSVTYAWYVSDWILTFNQLFLLFLFCGVKRTVSDNCIGYRTLSRRARPATHCTLLSLYFAFAVPHYVLYFLSLIERTLFTHSLAGLYSVAIDQSILRIRHMHNLRFSCLYWFTRQYSTKIWFIQLETVMLAYVLLLLGSR